MSFRSQPEAGVSSQIAEGALSLRHSDVRVFNTPALTFTTTVGSTRCRGATCLPTPHSLARENESVVIRHPVVRALIVDG